MNPTILYDNRFLNGTITATGVSDDTPLHITDLRPYTWLQFPAAGTNYLTVSLASPMPVNCLGIIGHNLGTAGATISVEFSTDGSTWLGLMPLFAPATDRALLKPFSQVSARNWRVKIVTATIAPRLAVCMLGVGLNFPLPPDSGFVPYSESVEVESNDSKTGHPLGAIVRYFPVDISPTFSHPTRAWVEDSYKPFRENYSRYRKYFFWAWDLTTYPDQVFFVQDVGRFDPGVSTLAYYDKLKLTLKGVAEP